MQVQHKFLIVLTLILSAFLGAVFGEEIRQEFTSRADFNSFWNVSTWGDDAQQYSSSNVVLDTVNGWLRLKISASPAGVKPINGEVSSKRTDFLYGSYRASIKFDNIPGGVVGWFVYRTTSDLHEIDVEYLTRDIRNIHFTLHHITTSVDYAELPVSFDPTADFHEYRFDWYPAKVVYFIDGKAVDTLTKKVPDAACSIMLNFWSANIADWGGPAPAKEAWMYVDYMRYYSDIPTSTTTERFSKTAHPNLFTIAHTGNRVTLQTEDQLRNSTIVYDQLGRKIFAVTGSNCPGEMGRITWNASGVANGTYILKTNGGTDVQSDLLKLTR